MEERFATRGIIGTDHTPGCFVCGGKSGLHKNISAFIESKTSGKRIVSMFNGKGVRLDYREREPDYIQVKIGVCRKHENELKKLHGLTRDAGVITEGMIRKASL